MSLRIQLTISLITILLVTNMVFVGILMPKFGRYMKWIANGAFLLLFASGLFWLTPNLLGEAFCVYIIGLAMDRLHRERSRPPADPDEAPRKDDLPPNP